HPLRPPTPPLFPYTTLFRSQGMPRGKRFLHADLKHFAPNCAACFPGFLVRNASGGTCRMRRFFPAVSIQKPAYFGYFVRHPVARSEEHTSELQSHLNLVCRL